MIGIVIVSHSEMIAEGLKEYAEGINKNKIKIIAAGGADDGRIGTNTLKIIEAIEEIFDGNQILIMVDLGSAVLSTEMAIDMLDDEIKEKITIIDAPLIEGTITAVRMAQEIDDVDKIISKVMEVREHKKLI